MLWMKALHMKMLLTKIQTMKWWNIFIEENGKNDQFLRVQALLVQSE